MPSTTVSTQVFSTVSGISKTQGRGGQSNAVSGTDLGSYLVSLFINKGSAFTDQEIGFCAIDLNTFYCSLTQFADTRSYVRTLHKLSLYPPNKLIIPSSMFQQSQAESDLILFLKENLGDVLHAHPEARHFFTSAIGHTCIQLFALPEQIQSLELALQGKTAALSALGGLFKHLENSMGVRFAKESIQFHLEPISGTMMIDTFTARALELVVPAVQVQPRASLFHTLNHTKTMMGARLLRWTILQPLTDLETIENRLDAVEALAQSQEQYANLSNALKDIPNVESLISTLITSHVSNNCAKKAEINIGSVLTLQKLLTAVPTLRDALKDSTAKLLRNALTIFFDNRLQIIQDAVSKVIDPAISASESTPIGIRNQRCFAVKTGLNGFLDVARQAYRETTNDIHSLVQEYTDLYRLPLKISFNTSHGFQIEMKRTPYEKAALPNVFINVIHRHKRTYCTTLDLLKLNERIKESIEEIYLLSDRIISELIETIREQIGVLYHVSESIALLDMLVSFAHCANMYEYVRPHFSDTLGLQASRHPIKEKISSYVPNDTYIDTGCSVQLITGPNMSGKTVYLKQVALNVILSQIGCFCAAKFAMIRVTSHLFAVMCFSDSIQTNASTFMVEMRGASYILQNIQNDSLVLMDELGRGTSSRDALGITFAIIESVAKTKAFVLFATHFHSLTHALQIYPNIVNLHFDIQYNGSEMKFLHKIADGECEQHSYGLNLAATLEFPPKLLKHAQVVRQKLGLRKFIPLSKESLKDRLYHEITHRLNSVLSHSHLDPENLVSYLSRFRNEAKVLFLELDEKTSSLNLDRSHVSIETSRLPSPFPKIDHSSSALLEYSNSNFHSVTEEHKNVSRCSPTQISVEEKNTLPAEVGQQHDKNALFTPEKILSNSDSALITGHPGCGRASATLITPPATTPPIFMDILQSNTDFSEKNTQNEIANKNPRTPSPSKYKSSYSASTLSLTEDDLSYMEVTTDVSSPSIPSPSTLHMLMQSKKRLLRDEKDLYLSKNVVKLFNLTELNPPNILPGHDKLNRQRKKRPLA